MQGTISTSKRQGGLGLISLIFVGLIIIALLIVGAKLVPAITEYMAIEKAIQGSGLGLNPSNDGKMVRIPIPPLTEERRRELAKVVRKMGEDARVAVRSVRREAIEKLKDREKKREISEDVVKRGQERIQKETDAHVKKIDEILKSKEQEILEV